MAMISNGQRTGRGFGQKVGALGAAMVLAVALVLGTSTPVRAEAGAYLVDADHTTVGFSVRHMFTNLTGSFGVFSGTLELDPDSGKITAVQGEVTATSVDTRHTKRDTHLRDPDFFNVPKFPAITFVGKTFEQVGQETHISGDFTLLGVTRTVTFTTRFLGEGKDPWGNVRAGLSAHARVNRKDFGMTFNKVLDTGGLLIGEEVEIDVQIEAIRK